MDSKEIITYQEALEWLYRQLPMFSRVGAAAYKPGLDTSLALDAFFGHPHRRFRSIHVGGTNGKGSTSHSLAAVLQAQGYKVGLYTSPHLADFRERIRVNGDMIPKAAVPDFIRRFKESGYEGHPSFFELTMMMAFDWFARAEVDYAVIEVGMGGRLDSTNIITPIASVITNISKDHTQFLGDTLLKIAGEKAGIIKSGIPVVIGEAEGDIRTLFAERAANVGAPIYFAQEDKSLPDTSDLDNVCLNQTHAFSYDLKGDYQSANLRTVLCALKQLRDNGIIIDDDSIVQGLSNVCSLTGFTGRWMKLSDTPLVIADTGHNEAGLRYNFAQLERLQTAVSDRKLHIVAGFVADKDVDHILDLFPKKAIYYFTQAQIPRALDVESLAGKAYSHDLKGDAYNTVAEAYNAALNSADKQDLVYVGGSTFIVADLLAYLAEKE